MADNEMFDSSSLPKANTTVYMLENGETKKAKVLSTQPRRMGKGFG